MDRSHFPQISVLSRNSRVWFLHVILVSVLAGVGPGRAEGPRGKSAAVESLDRPTATQPATSQPERIVLARLYRGVAKQKAAVKIAPWILKQIAQLGAGEVFPEGGWVRLTKEKQVLKGLDGIAVVDARIEPQQPGWSILVTVSGPILEGKVRQVQLLDKPDEGYLLRLTEDKAASAMFLAVKVAIVAKGAFFSVALEQGGHAVDISDHTARLHRAPFTIAIRMKQDGKEEFHYNGVAVCASFMPNLFEATVAGKDGCKTFSPDCHDSGYVDDHFNPHKAMFVGFGMNYWFYESPTSHRFDKVVVEGEWANCEREISNLDISNETEDDALRVNGILEDDASVKRVEWRKVPIERIENNILYVVFLKIRQEDAFDHETWAQKVPLKIIFDDKSLSH